MSSGNKRAKSDLSQDERKVNLHFQLLEMIQGQRRLLALSIISGTLASILSVALAYLISHGVNRVFLRGMTRSEMPLLIGSIPVIILLRGGILWLSEGCAETFAVRVKHAIRSRILSHINKLGPAYTQKEQRGELVHTYLEGVEALHDYFSQYLPQIAYAAFIPITILVFVFPLDLISGVIFVVTAPLIPLFMILIGKKAQALTDRQYKRMSRLAAHFVDSLQGLTTLKMFGQAKTRLESIGKASDNFRNTTMRVLQVTFLSALTLELLATISTALVAVQIGLRLLSAGISFPEALFILIIAPEFYQPFRDLGLKFHAGQEGLSAAKRIFYILDQKPETDWQAGGHGTADVPAWDRLHAKNISFTYPGEELPALRDLSFSVKKGDHIALVGPSGAGKSTLLHLLMGFYTPDKGQILVDSHPLSEIDPRQWHLQVAWVPQEPTLFHDTVAANLRLAAPDASQRELQAAARAAHLDHVITALPDGYQTVIGEEGTKLSGGEAQRLALARAVLQDAPLLILDEPTSQMDPLTERQLFDSTRKLMAGRTVITIAHRLNTITSADQIIVFQQGRIVDSGTHQELFKKQGPYKNLLDAFIREEEWIASPVSDVNQIDDPWTSKEKRHIQGVPDTTPSIHNDRPAVQVLQRLVSFLKPAWKRVLLSITLGVLTIGSSIGLLGTSAWLISSAALHPPIGQLTVAIVGVRFFGISRGIARYFERLTTHNVTFRALTKLLKWFYAALEPLAPARIMTYRTGDLLKRMISDVDTLEDFYVRMIAPPAVGIFIVGGTSLYLSTFDPLLGFILFSGGMIVGLGIPLFIHRLSRSIVSRLSGQKAVMQNQALDFIQGLPDLTAFGQNHNQLKSCLQAELSHGEVQRSIGWWNGCREGLSGSLADITVWFLLFISIPLVRGGSLSGLYVAAILLMADASFEALQPTIHLDRIVTATQQSARRLIQVIDDQPQVEDPAHPRSIPSHPGISAKNLCFTYPGANQPALDGVSFHLQTGQKIALVGPSGAGKSTLLQLLLRFWEDPASSLSVTPGDFHISSYLQDDIRQLISPVPQSNYYFHDTVWENLSIGNPTASRSDIRDAAAKAGIDTVIRNLPQEYDTILGERGSRLSSGERQRLALARAYLKDSPILILDEPTANLDPITEKKILENIWASIGGKSLLMVTHRLVGLERMDQILVLHEGKIVERGTHNTLLEEEGLYHQMWSIQHHVLNVR